MNDLTKKVLDNRLVISRISTILSL